MSPSASSAIAIPPEAEPVSPASTFMATVSETSGPPWIDSTASRTVAKAGMAATTAPKPTRLPTVRTGKTEELAPASMLSRKAGRRR